MGQWGDDQLLLHPLGQLLDLRNKKSGGTVLSDFSMTGAGHYDGAGNLLSLTASLPGAPGSYSGTTTLQYDGKDQLNHEQSSRLGSYTNTFAFDGAGNPTTFKGATQTFNSANQNNAFTYDGDGNPKSWQSNNLTFDAGNHLTAIGTTLTAGYNAEGLRAWKQSTSGTTYFLYDGLTPIVELDGNANVKAVNTWGANGLLSRRTVSTNSSVFYTFDMQGSTAQRLDSNGNILGSYGFDAFGTRASTDNSTDPYSGFGAQFGYYRDSETGLSLCGERYYDPGQGRWLNRDPIGYSGGLNVYGYGGSNPLSGMDPSGLSWETPGGWIDSGSGFAVGPGYDPNSEITITGSNPPGFLQGAADLIGNAGRSLRNNMVEMLSGDTPGDVVGREILAAEMSPSLGTEGEEEVESSGCPQGRPNARPEIDTKLPDRVTKILPDGEGRTAAENAQARNFFERNREAARQWWSARTGKDWPTNTTHDEHPRPLKDGGDPLFIEPGFNGSANPHMGSDFPRWGRMGGRPRKNN